MSRTVATLLVVVLVVLAGCGGSSGGGGTDGADGTQTVTGTDAPGETPGAATTGSDGGDGSTPGATTAPDGPTTATATDAPPDGTDTPTATPQDPDTLSAPPGVDLIDGEVTDPAALVDGHVATMEELSGTQYLAWRETDTERRWLWIGGYGPGGRTAEVRNASGTYAYWTDGERAAARFENDSTTRRTVSTGGTAVRGEALGQIDRNERQLRTYFAIGQWEVEDRTVRDGRAVFVLNLTDRDLSGIIDTNFVGDDRGLLGLSGQAYVTENGLVTEMQVDAEFRRDREGTEYTERFRLTTNGIGSTGAEPPSWFEESPRVDAEYVADGTAVKLTHSDGPALRFNTDLRVYREGSDGADGVVTTDSRVETGDTLYVYAVSEGGSPSFYLTDDPDEIPDDAVDLSARGDVRVEATLDGVRLVYATEDDDEDG